MAGFGLGIADPFLHAIRLFETPRTAQARIGAFTGVIEIGGTFVTATGSQLGITGVGKVTGNGSDASAVVVIVDAHILPVRTIACRSAAHLARVEGIPGVIDYDALLELCAVV